MMLNTENIKTELVIIGGSAGSLKVILEMIKKLNDKISVPVLLVLHRKAHSTNILQALLQQLSPLDVVEIDDKTEIENNKIYITPADYHVLFEDKKIMSLDSSEKMNYSRPSIDVTFKSAAEIYGENLVGVLLSGANADGVVVGTAIVNQVATNLTADGKATADTVQAVATLVRGLASGVRSARLAAAE